MANNKSAEKRIRQNEKRNVRNRNAKKTVKTSIRRFEEDVKKKDKVLAEASFKTMVKLMDTAARKGLFHKKAIARKKSRMHKLLNSIEAA